MNHKQVALILFLIAMLSLNQMPSMLSLNDNSIVPNSYNSRSTSNSAITIQVKPVLLTYTRLTFEKWSINETTWNSLAAQYHLIMAGLPYEIKPFDEIIRQGIKLSEYSLIIFIDSVYLNESLYSTVYTLLKSYLNTGGSILSLDYPFVLDEHDNYNDTILRELFNVNETNFANPQPFDVIAGNLTTLKYAYKENQVIWKFEDKSMDFTWITPSSFALKHYIIAWAKANNTFFPLAIANEFSNGRSAIFLAGAYFQWIDQTQLLLRTIQWCVYGSLPPVSLLISPGNITWMFTVDADLTSIPSITIKSSNLILNLSQEYRFLISWGIVAGPHPPGLSPNWTLLRPYFLRYVELGHELASHSRTHPTWIKIKFNSTINQTARLISELGGSKKDIEGNLSVPIYVFHTPDGDFYIDWYPFLVKYYNITITPGADQSWLMGGFFFPELDADKIIFWRTTYSDFEYFYLGEFPINEFIKREMSNFNYFYNFRRALPYINLWHDYSIANDTLYPLLKEVLRQQLIETKDVYSMLPIELLQKLRNLRDIRFNVTYHSEEIQIDFDVSNIPYDRRPYLSNMAFMIENNKTIKQVLLNGKQHLAFQRNRVILYNVKNDYNSISVLYDTPSTLPHIRFTDVFINSVKLDKERFEVLISNASRRLGRIEIRGLSNPKFVLINNAVYKPHVESSVLVVNVSTLEGPVNVTILFSGDIYITNIERKIIFIPQNLTSHYPFSIYVNNSVGHNVKVIISLSFIRGSDKLVTLYTICHLKYGLSENILSLNLLRNQGRLKGGNVTVIVRILSFDNKTIIDEKEFQNALQIKDTRLALNITRIAVIAVLASVPIYVIYKVYLHKKRKREKLFDWIRSKST